MSNLEILWIKCLRNKQTYYFASCFHLPRPLYQNATIIQALSDDIETIALFNDNPLIILAGNLNLLCIGFLEWDYGLVQLVHQPTHGNNILDKFFCSRPAIFSASVVKSLIKTKHQAVLVQDASTSGLLTSPVPKRKEVTYLDRKSKTWTNYAFVWRAMIGATFAKC